MALPMPFPELSVQTASFWLPSLFRFWLERGGRLQVQQSVPPHTPLTNPKLHISRGPPEVPRKNIFGKGRAGVGIGSPDGKARGCGG